MAGGSQEAEEARADREPAPSRQFGVTPDADVMLEFLQDVGQKVASVPQLAELIDKITLMTQDAFRATASSLLLLDEKKEKLFFEVAEGKAVKTLRQVRLDAQSGIAGWVARHGKPLIVNNVDQDKHFNGSVDKISGFVTKSIICAPLMVQRRTIGVIEVLNKEDGSKFSERDLEALVSVASTAAISIENLRLQRSIIDSYKNTIKALAAAIDAKDPYTRGHSQRVMEYTLLGAGSLSLSEPEVGVLEYTGMLHDIGKIGIADRILTKPGPLTEKERNTIQRHSIIGADILKDIPFLAKARELVLHHHERYDGKGYPDGLKGEDIPIGARLLAVADAFDTMTTDRAYRSALGVDRAVKELHECASTQFCPVAVDAFLSGYDARARKAPRQKKQVRG